MSGVQTADNWQEIGAGGSAIDAQGELVGLRERPINPTNGEGTDFRITVGSLPPGYIINFRSAIIPDTSEWTRQVVVGTVGTEGSVTFTSPTTNEVSSVTSTITYEVFDGSTLIETVVQNITLSTYDPVYIGVVDTQPTAFVSSGVSSVLASPTRIDRGTQFSVPYSASGSSTQYAIVNLPNRIASPIFTVGGFELVFDNTNRFAAPGNAALIIDRRYTTYLIPVRQATTITLI